MPKVYRIYPGIGISRLGNSPTEFFLSPEIPGLGPLELTPDDSVQQVRKYKDGQHKLRRQAARFRIFEFDDGAGTVREITAENGIQIEWRVELANEKAAAGRFVAVTTPEDVQHPRNPDTPTSTLIIKPSFGPISGLNANVKASSEGTFKGNTVYLGELRTDHKGRLLILGGRGISESFPPSDLGDGSRPPDYPHHPANTFANNENWHDDVADGPISATIRIPGQPDQVLNNAAWIIVAPPDYAPYTNGITTLYDIAFQACGLKPPQIPSFQSNVLPILKAAAGLRWVSALPIWNAISTDYAQLSRKNDPAADQLRQDTLGLLMNIPGGAIVDFNFTDIQTQVLNQWASGNFVSDFNPASRIPGLTPDGLDVASLTQAVGGGFYPGIEAGIRMTAPEMYSSPFRITDKPFTYDGVPQVPHAGFITRTMACPWQSDFYECAQQTETTVWWPAQRPIEVFVDPAAHVQKPWIDSIPNHKALVEKFWKLGLVEPLSGGSSEPLIEGERDPSVPHV